MKILVAVHKPYQMPKDQTYLPVMVGAALQEGYPANYTPDNTGQNMSEMNPFYNELTALYWAKYNLQDEDVIGLMHYRRYFGKKASHDLTDILTETDIRNALKLRMYCCLSNVITTSKRKRITTLMRTIMSHIM